ASADPQRFSVISGCDYLDRPESSVVTWILRNIAYCVLTADSSGNLAPHVRQFIEALDAIRLTVRQLRQLLEELWVLVFVVRVVEIDRIDRRIRLFRHRENSTLSLTTGVVSAITEEHNRFPLQSALIKVFQCGSQRVIQGCFSLG